MPSAVAPARQALAAAVDTHRRATLALADVAPGGASVQAIDRGPAVEAAARELDAAVALAERFGQAIGSLDQRSAARGARPATGLGTRGSEGDHRARLARELDRIGRLEQAASAALAELEVGAGNGERRFPAAGGRWLRSPFATSARLREAVARALYLVHVRHALDELTRRRRAYAGWLDDEEGLEILAFDPVGGDIAIARGDIRHAESIAVLVPGASTTPGRLEPWYGPWRDGLHAAVEDTGRSAAVVAWLGYAPPASPVSSTARRDDRARQGAAALAAFIDDLRDVSRGEITVVGHSYGGVLAARAAPDLDAVRLILAGSPGLGREVTEHADLGAGGPVYAMAYARDPIAVADVRLGTWLHDHGGRAAAVPGVVELELDEAEAQPLSRLGVHSAYGLLPSSLAAQQAVITGSCRPPARHEPAPGPSN